MEVNIGMKKLLSALTLSVAVLGLAACGDEETQNASNQKQEEVAKQKPSTVSAESLKKITFGDSKATVKKVLGTPKTKEEDTWEYEGKDNKDSYVTFFFDIDDKVESFEQKGILEKDTTRNYEDRIKNFDNPEKSTGSYALKKEDTTKKEDFKTTITKIANNSDSPADKFNEVDKFAYDYEPTEDEVSEFTTYILAQYQSKKYLKDISNDEYMLENIFKSSVVDHYYKYDQNNPYGKFAFDFYQNSKYVYRGAETVGSESVLANERQMDKSMIEIGENNK